MTNEKKQVVNTVIPAQPGWFVAWHFPAEGDQVAMFTYEPILAWAITATFVIGQYADDHRAHCTPITASGEQCHGRIAIKSPDGQIDFPGDRAYPE
jgi:hypothetical protein